MFESPPSHLCALQRLGDIRENIEYKYILQRGGGGASRPVGERDAREPALAPYDSRRLRSVQLRGDEEGSEEA